jgi:hypothetical protein
MAYDPYTADYERARKDALEARGAFEADADAGNPELARQGAEDARGRLLRDMRDARMVDESALTRIMAEFDNAFFADPPIN